MRAWRGVEVCVERQVVFRKWRKLRERERVTELEVECISSEGKVECKVGSGGGGGDRRESSNISINNFMIVYI